MFLFFDSFCRAAKVEISIEAALGISAQAADVNPVMVVKTAASPDTIKFLVMTTAPDELKPDPETRRQLTLLPGQTEAVLSPGETDEEPLHYLLYQQTPQGMRTVGDIYRAPGQTITIDLSADPATVSGSPLMDNINAARQSIAPAMKAISEAVKARDEEAYHKAVEQTRKGAADFIRNNPSNPGSIELMNILSSDQMDVAEMIKPEAKEDINGPMYDYYMSRFKAAQQRKIQAEKVAPGKPAPDFSLPDPTGKMVSLSSLKGKYVMLDFWGSWCGWCIKGIPQMKEQYERLKDKVYFVSIACNDSKQAWTAALEKYNMPWIQLWSDPDILATESVMTLYAVEGFPTKFIIGPDGNIVNKVVGEDPSFYDLFDNLK